MKVSCLIILLVSVMLCCCSCSSTSDSSNETSSQTPAIDYDSPKIQPFTPIEIPKLDFGYLYEDKTYTISYTAYLSHNNHVGNSWGYGIKYDGEYERFDPDYDMGVAWKRLSEGNPTETDIMLLKHELLESQ